ncbi:MAG: hypothetical protein LBJ48_07880 [Coriobacteriales bacterium]|jgi:hypothetical protein|nr:hypothetical protein [Coriobacteriales bacterium]
MAGEDEATRDLNGVTGIGTGIAQVLEAAYRELEENEAVDTDLDVLFWSSINANAQSSMNDSLDSTFYQSIVKDEAWAPRQQDLPSFDPPSGQPVTVEGQQAGNNETGISTVLDKAELDKDALINQVAEEAVREAERLVHRKDTATNQKGDLLLFTDGEDEVYVGKPGQGGSGYDEVKSRMKNLLGSFYRGSKQELEQVAQQVLDSASQGTPVDVRKWVGR